VRRVTTRTDGALPAPPLLSGRNALFLDFDGTLVELAARPDRVVVDEQLPGTLDLLADRLGGAVAIITGRWLADVDGMLAPVVLPGAGLHGAEVRDTVGAVQVRVAGGIGELAAALRERFGGDPRVIVEDKGAGVALHFRQAPERADECRAALRALAAEWPGLEVVTGKMVIEARVLGVDKAVALRRLCAEPPFAGRVPVFVGDDVTDEDGFDAAAAAGGFGVKVGDGPTRGRYRCADVAGVHAWLHASLATG
jgi:trehalose 6-phosphate phosphatase